MRGVNTQGAFRSVLHKGKSESEIIDRVGKVITDLGFSSIRIGGTPMFGSSFNPAAPAYGWSEYWHNPEVERIHGKLTKFDDSYNYNFMALKMAAEYDLTVWITYHRYTSALEIYKVREFCEKNNIIIAGETRDNEPYLPERFSDIRGAVQDYNDEKFLGMHWPAMYVLGEDQPPNRKARQEELEAIMNTEASMSYGEGIEIHCYYVPESGKTEYQYIYDACRDTMRQYGLYPTQIMVGEWSGKNQETFADEDLSKVVLAYLDLFERHGVTNYYQLLGSNHPLHGLWNFDTMTPNRVADVFTSRK